MCTARAGMVAAHDSRRALEGISVAVPTLEEVALIIVMFLFSMPRACRRPFHARRSIVGRNMDTWTSRKFRLRRPGPAPSAAVRPRHRRRPPARARDPSGLRKSGPSSDSRACVPGSTLSELRKASPGRRGFQLVTARLSARKRAGRPSRTVRAAGAPPVTVPRAALTVPLPPAPCQLSATAHCKPARLDDRRSGIGSDPN